MLSLPLITERLTIRVPEESDMENWVRLYTDPGVITYMQRAVNRNASEWWSGLQSEFTSIELPLTVANLSESCCIGQAGYLKVDGAENSVEIYCRLLPEAWGKGYGSEICQALVSTALVNLGMSQVLGYVHPKNAASISMLQRLGFSLIGHIEKPNEWQNGHEIYEKRAVTNHSTNNQG